MTPDKLAKSDTEHAHQVALFAYAAVARQKGFEFADYWSEGGNMNFGMGNTLPVPALEWLHAVPNGGSRGNDAKTRAIRGGQLKAEGVKRGVADIFLPWASANCHGLYIEMKKPSVKPKREGGKGGLSNDQIKFKNYCHSIDFGFVTCYSWKEAAIVLRTYIEWSE